MAREKVVFEPNVPVHVALKYPVGKIVSGVYGEQVYYTTSDERAMYLDLHVGQKVNELGPQPGETLVITKKWSGSKKDPMTWSVERAQQSIPEPDPGNELQEKLYASITQAQRKIGERGDGTFGVPAPKAALAQRKPAVSSPAAPPWPDSLLAESIALTDVFAKAWEYARETYSGQVKPEEVRSFVITSYIEFRKRTGHAA